MLTTLNQAITLKALLWEGKTIHAITRTFRPKVSPATVGHIRAGIRWADAPWPDGSKGRLSEKRARAIEAARRKALEDLRL